MKAQTETKHTAKSTPGPLKTYGWTSHGLIIATDDGTYLGYAQGYPHSAEVLLKNQAVSEEEATANATLWAASPDMLVALEKVEAALRQDTRQKSIIGDEVEYHLDGQTMGYAIELARSAIRKAKGESL